MGSAAVSGAFSTGPAENQPLINLECVPALPGKEQGRILAVVAPAQVQEQGRTLSQAGSEEKTLERGFHSELKISFSTRGMNILEALQYPGKGKEISWITPLASHWFPRISLLRRERGALSTGSCR